MALWRAWHPDMDRVSHDCGLLDFFIVGVAKAGTTALDHTLRQHPKIQMAQQKEAHFFSNPAVDWVNPDYRLLHLLFDWSAKDVVRGEATPGYSYWPESIARIRDYNPNARLIFSLRHPSFRCYSHWRDMRNRGWDTMPFAEAIREGRSRVAESEGGVHMVYSHVERGFYAPQIRRMLACFPRSNVLFTRSDERWLWPNHSTHRICEFLGVEQPPFHVKQEYVVLKQNDDRSTISENDRVYLDELYADDLIETQELTGLDLEEWMEPEYEEPLCPP